MRKHIVAAVLMLMLSLFVMAQMAQGAKTVVRIANPWTATNNFTKAFAAAEEIFEAKHPDIDIQVEFGWTDDKYKPAVLAGAAPDIFTIYAVPTWAAGGYIKPLDQLAAKYGVHRADFVPGAWDQNVWRNTLYAVQLQIDPNFSLVWNKDMFRYAGFNPDLAPKTLTEFNVYCSKLTLYRADGTATQIGMAPWLVPGGNANTLYTWGWLFGGEWYDFANNKTTAHHRGNVEALEYLAAYWRKYHAIYDQLSVGVTSSRNMVMSGREAMQFWTAGSAISTVRSNPAKIGQGSMPSNPMAGVNNATWLSGWALGLTATSKVPDEAFRFIHFLTTDPEGVEAVFSIGGWFPANIRTPYFRRLSADPLWSVVLNSVVSAINYRPAIPAQSLYSSQLDKAFTKVMSGEVTATEALEQTSMAVDAEMAKYK